MTGTIIGKILAEHLVEGQLQAGSEIAIRIDQALTQDVTGTMVYLELEAMGIQRVSRKAVSRQQLQLRRRWTVEVIYDPPPGSWWESTTVGGLDRTQFELFPRGGRSPDEGPAATAMFWNLEPLAGCWGE